MHKTCTCCKETLELEKFVLDKRRKDGYGSRCRTCTYKNKKYSPERQRRYKEKCLYGLKSGQYEEMYADQKGACKICEKNFDRLYIDHDHISGNVRGLLCHSCNVALGHLGDNINYLTNAITYLNEHAGTDWSSKPASSAVA